MNPDISASVVRTVVPIIVAQIVALLAARGIDAGAWTEVLSQVVGALVATLYYYLARLLETYVKPRFGWLLGKAKTPTYDQQGPAA